MTIKGMESTLRPQTFSPSRRDVLRGLAGPGLSLVALLDWLHGGSGTEARKKRGKKKQGKKQSPPLASPQPPPLPFNQYGCLDIGQSCQGDSTLCCSGICDPQSSNCVAHNRDICFPDTNFCTTNVQTPCNGNTPGCFCTLTTGNAGFCADARDNDDIYGMCRRCNTDMDCQEEYGPGAACIVLAGACTPFCLDTDRTACMRPCF
jgi:hypothetical protein